MKSYHSGLLFKHSLAGFAIGIAFVLPELLLFHSNGFLNQTLHIPKAILTKSILSLYPIVLGILFYKFGKSKISDIKINQQLLQAEAERQQLLEGLYEYKFALDQSAIVSIIDESGKIKRVNSKFEKLTGFAEKDVIGRAIWRLPSSIQDQKLFNEIKRTADKGKVWKGQIVYYRPGGDCYTNAIVVPLSKNEGGNNDCLIIQYDITQEKNAQVALRKIEEENRIILENTQTLICAHDADGKILNINAAGAKILGMTPTEIIGKSVADFFGMQLNLDVYLQNLLEHGYSEGFFKIIDSKGEKKSLLFKNVLYKKDGAPYIIGSATDITETIKAKRELENQKAFISLMIDKSPNMILVLNERGEILLINKAAKNYFQFTEQEEILNLTKVNQLNSEISKLTTTDIKFLFDEKDYLNYECELYCQETKESNWFKVQRTTFADNKGDRFKLIIGTDITEKNKTEQEIIEAKKLVENTLKDKEQFFANMSHEIRTPLNSVIGFSHLLEETKLDECQQEYLQIIKIAGKNLLSIINDILDLSKMVTGNLTLNCNKLQLDEIVKNTARMFGTKIVEKGIYLRLNISNSLPGNLYGDEERLNQILINLVSNAIKFTNTGGIEINVKQLRSANPGKAFICIDVKDTGIGIEKEKLELIFQRFTQAHTEMHKYYGGTGLGLNIVKNLVEIFGGEINVSSTLGQGTTFRVVLPFKTFAPEEIAEPKRITSNNQQLNNKAYRILLADDNNTNAKLATKILEKRNYTVEHVRDGLDVLTALERDTFDLILMDVQMITLNGIETTRIIRAKNESYSNIPIIALTAHSFVGKKTVCTDAGMNDYLSKPFSPDQLFNSITNIMEGNVAELV